MDLEQLTEYVTKEVLRILVSQKINKKGTILISRQNNCDINNYELDYIEDFDDPEKIYSYDYIIITKLNNTDLSDTALGRTSSRTSEAMVYGIMNGKKVILLDSGIEFRKYKYLCNPAFYNMMSEYEEKLKSFGIIIASEEGIRKIINTNEDINKNPELVPEKADSKSYSTEKNLITMEIASGISEYSSEIVLKKGSIITPSAKDVFFQNKNKVTFL